MHNFVKLICSKISTMYRQPWSLGPGAVHSELLVYKLLTLSLAINNLRIFLMVLGLMQDHSDDTEGPTSRGEGSERLP